MIRNCFVLVMLSSTLVADSGREPVSSEVQTVGVEQLYGKWKMIAMERGGRPFNVKITGMIVTRDHVQYLGGFSFKIKIRVPPGAKPGEFDTISSKGKVFQKRYELRGDVLKICWDETSGKRPSELKTKPGTRLTLFTFKRAK